MLITVAEQQLTYKVVIPFADVQEIEKKMTALVIPNAIGVYTSKERYTFASLISRDSTFDVLMNIWRIAHPDMEMTASTAPNGVEGEAASPAESAIDPDTTAKAKGLTHKATQCGCTQHYAEVALDTTFPSTPEKVYNLMFNSGWYRTFMSESQKLRGECGDSGAAKLVHRTFVLLQLGWRVSILECSVRGHLISRYRPSLKRPSQQLSLV